MSFTSATFLNIPSTVDLRQWADHRQDQVSLGMCTAETMINACEATALRLGIHVDLSEEENYYDSRAILGIQNVDGGSTIAAALQAASKGIATEATDPFSIPNVNQKPSAAAYTSAANFKVLGYEQLTLSPDSIVQREAMIKSALAQGYFVLFETEVNNQFTHEHRTLDQQIWTNNTVTNPTAIVGRHALTDMFYGLPGTMGSIGAENSWGTNWGDNGFGLIGSKGYMDKAYIITSVQINGVVHDFYYTSQRIDVAELYTALFGRAPENAGLDYWASQMASGATQAQVAEIMFGVAPARAYYPANASNVDVISDFYSHVLGRSADAGGLAYWSGQLDHGATHGQVIVSMIDSTLNYQGADQLAIGSRELFENKLNVGLYYSVQMGGDNVNVASHAFDGITSDVASVEIIKMGLPPDLA